MLTVECAAAKAGEYLPHVDKYPGSFNGCGIVICAGRYEQIEALITEHKVLTGGGGGLTPTFNDQGGGGLSAGGGPKIEEKEFSNHPVLNALTTIHRGVNYGFNKKAWKNWYVQQNVPQAVNLRRSE